MVNFPVSQFFSKSQANFEESVCIIWEYQEEKFPLKNMRNCILRTSEKIQWFPAFSKGLVLKYKKKNHKTPHLNYNHIFWPVNYGVISFPWMWYMPIEDLIWYLALRNNLYIFHSLHWIKIFLTATITDLSDGWRCSMKVNISSRIKEIGPVLVLLRKVNDH